jgi:hypothetical protein
MAATEKEKYMCAKVIEATRGIRLGVTKSATEHLLRDYPNYCNGFSLQSAQADIVCHFDNVRLSKTKMMPLTVIDVSLSFNNDILTKKYLRMATEHGIVASVLEIQGEGNGAENTTLVENHDRFVQIQRGGDGKDVTRMGIRNDDSQSTSILEADWQLNLNCLTMIRGCQDALEMFSSR